VLGQEAAGIGQPQPVDAVAYEIMNEPVADTLFNRPQ